MVIVSIGRNLAILHTRQDSGKERLQEQLLETQSFIPLMPREAYYDFDGYVSQKIKDGDVEIVEQAEQEDPMERVLLSKNNYAMA